MSSSAESTRQGLDLSLRDVAFHFASGPFRLEVPALDIAAGARVACLGPSGSGKSTLLQLLAGIQPAASGSVRLGGVDWRELDEGRRRHRRLRNVGLVFQDFELLEALTVRENVLLPYLVQRQLRLDAAVRERALDLARATGIGALLQRRPAALSRGERQRVALCRALITDPPVVLADEPTGSLDPRAGRAALELLLEHVRARGATLVMVTHDHSLVGAFDQILQFDYDARGTAVVGRAGAGAPR